MGGNEDLAQHEITYLVSGRDLVHQRQGRAASAPVIVACPDYDQGLPDGYDGPKLFDPLPGTAAEAAAVRPELAKYARTAPRVYTGRAAGERTVKDLRSPSTLLLSTHGFFGHVPGDLSVLQNPLLRCGIALAGANRRQGALRPGDDGILTGLEVLGIDLRNTDMVVLSACDTGVGDIQAGETIAGLRQAFQLAGADKVVSTLWPVPDKETATLIAEYFGALAAGHGPAAALRKAQVSMIQTRRRSSQASHPVFWAAFTLSVGSADALAPATTRIAGT